MKLLPLLSVFLFTYCFTIYTKNETILESQNIDTKNISEQKDFFVLSHTLSPDGLYLLLDGYKAEEVNEVNFIKEKYKENKGVKFNHIFEKGIGGCDQYVCGAILVIATTIMVLEITTLPFRVMSEPKERIQKEITTKQSNKIGILPTENISIVFLETKPAKTFSFQESKIFVPLSELELDSYNVKEFPYKLIYADNDKLILKGFLHFSEQVSTNKELQSIIQENEKYNPSAKCRKEFPFLVNQELKEKSDKLAFREICQKKYAKPFTLFWKNIEYQNCLSSIEECSSVTR